MITKPLIMLSIGGYFLYSIKNRKPQNSKTIVAYTLLAFAFSWLGDIFLLFSEKSLHYFLLGIFSFFCSQVLYIILFKKLTYKNLNIRKLGLYPLPFLIYFIGFYSLLWSELETVFKVAVFIYALSLSTMGVAALSRFQRSNKQSFVLVLVGGGLFILSDSCIAYSKFIESFANAGVVIMFTYILAQIFIMLGIKSFLFHSN